MEEALLRPCIKEVFGDVFELRSSCSSLKDLGSRSFYHLLATVDKEHMKLCFLLFSRYETLCFVHSV